MSQPSTPPPSSPSTAGKGCVLAFIIGVSILLLMVGMCGGGGNAPRSRHALSNRETLSTDVSCRGRRDRVDLAGAEAAAVSRWLRA